MFIRLLKYSIKNILRNKFLSISSILVLTLLMFFVNILFVLHSTSFKLIDSINSKLSISLYLDDGFDKNSIGVIDLINDIKKISNSIKVQYKNKEDVLAEIQERDGDLVKILEKSNPLPETIIVSSIPLENYKNVDFLIQSKLYLFGDVKKDDLSKKSNLADYKSQYERINKVISILHTLGIGLYIIMSIFIVSIGIIIYSIIGNFIYYYRDEIYITRLVGGSKVFIYGPFSLQGILYSLASFLISALSFYIFLKNINILFGGSYDLSFLFVKIYMLFVVEFFLFIFIGGFSGYFSSRKYLKKV